MKLRSALIFGSLLLSSIVLLILISKDSQSSSETIVNTEEIVEPIQEPLPEPEEPKPLVEEYTVKKGDFLGSILPKYGIPTHEVLTVSKEIFDLSKIRIGKRFTFIKDPPDAQQYTEIQYPIDIDNTLILRREGDSWKANKETAQYERKRTSKSFIVESSFWQAASTVGLRGADISALVQLFEYDIDFNTEIRSKGQVQVVLDGLYQNDTFVRYAAPDLVKFTNNNQTFHAIRYTTGDDKTLYYDENGISRKGTFLRSPIAYSRVTSGFNPKRFHPILKKPRPHNGTDFGAPTGTSIRSAADGKVTYARNNGGHGKFVKIKHGYGYETSYSHLSKILVRVGKRVKQGTIIGKVGSTGMSTGPHLHYQMWKNGRFVDAMKEKPPKTQKIPKDERAQFTKQKELLFAELKALE